MAKDSDTGYIAEQIDLSSISLDRRYCSQLERIVYVLKCCFAGMSLGKFDTGSDIFLYQIYGLRSWELQKKRAGLVAYDLINDPLSAVIIDNMRTRWGKFKPFQYLSMIPSVLLGFFSCTMPLIATKNGFSHNQKLTAHLALSYISETIGAFFGGGGYIDNVFTPSPNERTQLLTMTKFVSMFFSKLPEQLAGIIIDLYDDGVINGDIVTIYVTMKTIIWVITTAPTIMWYFVSKERVPQSLKPPKAAASLKSVFMNRPLLIYTMTGAIDGINIGTSEALYYRNVLGMTMFGTWFGIPGGPLSYLSYYWAPKFRKRFSTKALWFLQRGSVVGSELTFFLVGLIGKKWKWYSNVWIMGIVFALGNCLEMTFYATKQIVGPEINYEVLDYCEWKNGFRVEATINLVTGYINKVKDYLLALVNSWILQYWTGFQYGVDAVQSDTTKFRLFIMAYGPRLIPDMLSLIPMIFYNIDSKKRELMYKELLERRAQVAGEERVKGDISE